MVGTVFFMPKLKAVYEVIILFGPGERDAAIPKSSNDINCDGNSKGNGNRNSTGNINSDGNSDSDSDRNRSSNSNSMIPACGPQTTC